MSKAVNDQPFASMFPDEMISGGLADDFDGIIREARLVKFDYDGTIENPVLALRAKIERLAAPGETIEDDDKFVIQHYSAGALNRFTPSMDGNSESDEGVFALKSGSATALNNNTQYAQFLRAMLDAQVPRTTFSPDVRFLEGIKGHFNRIPPDKKAGQGGTGRDGKQITKKDVLCLTRFDGKDGANVAASTASTSTASASTATASAGVVGGDLDSKIKAIIVPAIQAAGATPTKKTALAGLVLKGMKGDKDASKATKRVSEAAFLESLAEDAILYDAEAGTVVAV